MDNNLSQQTTPIIDSKIALTLAGNKHELARELLSLLIKGLPASVTAIQSHVMTHNLIELKLQLHKLKGACSYCGVIRLKNTILEFENILKQQHTDRVASAFKKLEFEAQQLTAEALKLGAETHE
ncbi:MAG: Hpt domain-containing protein [Gammaproteobacteria bacterium]|nr:Hpt domain-containing protein [Gammaproteobacteria bacterium]